VIGVADVMRQVDRDVVFGRHVGEHLHHIVNLRVVVLVD
jgi:hypothetical protein